MYYLTVINRQPTRNIYRTENNARPVTELLELLSNRPIVGALNYYYLAVLALAQI